MKDRSLILRLYNGSFQHLLFIEGRIIPSTDAGYWIDFIQNRVSLFVFIQYPETSIQYRSIKKAWSRVLKYRLSK